MSQNLEQKMREILGSGTLLLREPMKDHTTFRVGGPADLMFLPASADELGSLIRVPRFRRIISRNRGTRIRLPRLSGWRSKRGFPG